MDEETQEPEEELDEDGNPIELEEELDEDGNPIGGAQDDTEETETPEPELDEDGNPIPAAAPVDTPVETPATPEPTTPAASAFELPAPPENYTYRGEEYPVTVDGETLHDPTYEDENSPQAVAVFRSLVELHGGDPDDPDADDTQVAMIRARADYERLQGRYDQAKERYETFRERQIETSLQSGLDGLRAQTVDVSNKIHTDWLSPLPEAARNELFGIYHQEASKYIEAERQSYIKEYTDMGMDPRRAQVRADARVLATPNIYHQALGTAIVSDFGGFMERIFKAMGVAKPGKAGMAAITAAATGVPGAAPTGTAPAPKAPKTAVSSAPPAPPGMGSPKGGVGTPGATAKVVPSMAEKAAAAKFGVDPVRYAQKSRAMNGVGKK